MNKKDILSRVDHTLLSQTTTWKEIMELCDDAYRYETASVCIPPEFVEEAKNYLGGHIAVCTVIGFPNGYQTTATKCFETADAIKDGADEIDMVINVGKVKAGKYEEILDEIKRIKQICGDHILKVIIETCLLTNEEKIKMCQVVTESGADYIKTSTGFSTAGATFEDIELFAKHVGKGVKIKAAGGIKCFDDAEKFISLGADRLGTSRLVALMKNDVSDSTY